jgi:hypothetical protein
VGGIRLERCAEYVRYTRAASSESAQQVDAAHFGGQSAVWSVTIFAGIAEFERTLIISRTSVHGLPLFVA